MKTFLIILGILLIFSRSLRDFVLQSVSGIIIWVRKMLIKNEAKEMEKLTTKITTIIEKNFVVEPCFQCFESEMVLDKVSSKGKSISYKCNTCGKEMYAPASSKKAEEIIVYWEKLQEWAETIRAKQDIVQDVTFNIHFNSQEVVMPYEQPFSKSIPANVKSEVWQRDGGKCVKCGSKKQLQFDQTIPVKNGAVIKAANIQIICKACNKKKQQTDTGSSKKQN